MASIRLKGKLDKWFDDKGFGFITPEKGTKSIFVHISAFDRNIPRRPKVGDTIFYLVHTDNKGKTKAVDARIEGVAPREKTHTARPTRHYKKRSSKSNWEIFFSFHSYTVWWCWYDLQSTSIRWQSSNGVWHKAFVYQPGISIHLRR